MSRLGTLVWFVLVLAAGFATFKVKYAVQDIEDELHRVRKQTVAEQQEIRVLTAEWTYLNQPERLADLNQRFLGLQPIAARQLQEKIAQIPLRAPDVATDTLVAAAQPAAPPAIRAVAASAPPSSAVAAATLPIRLAKAGATPHVRSLDSLIAQIAEAR